MTREEEIRQASIEYTYKNKPMCIGGGAFSKIMDEMNRNHSFEEGAKWADKTMLDRACEWLENRHNIEKCLGILTSRTEDLSKAFKQAMKGGAE